ncbi:winged helix DNA-binding domain-containing protein [Paenibacillus mendelii]|uniref:Winged helix DNA-binding domain-containing protein n=1 Tax=Paenibacillus mendelii TaxID=206163 RepID=A0ABV6J9M6_9BACL|nr:winged helix DNA-binding domain-containing protein [Paenibacillus mendelii]MCQ6559854.1 winged helix DNA-binding domain-containing protein [Paenibacillus mendelii]
MKEHNPNIPYQRLLNLRINGGRLDSPEQVVTQLGAMQAQDYHQALWAIGLRMQAATVTDIEQAIADRKIVLTWSMRGTIHFVPPADMRWMLKISASRLLKQDNRRLEQLELNQEIIERARQISYDAMQGGRRISRPVLMQLLEDEGISRQRGYHLLWYLGQSGHICLGPRDGKQQTFVLLDEWVPQANELSMDESLAVLAERYFTSHGPATVHDFAWWAGITLTDARRGVEAVQFRLVSKKVNDQVYWEGGQSRAGSVDAESTVYLLPGFDEHLLGYKDRSAVLRAEYASKIVPGNNGVFMPTILIDGQVAGLWKRTMKKKGIDMEFNLFAPHEDQADRILETARRYCTFMELPMAETSFQVVE